MQDELIAKENSSNKEKDQNLKQKTIGGFLWSFGGRGSQAVLQIIVLSILARLVTPYEFGIIGAALIVIGFSRIFSQIGIGPAIVQRPVLSQTHIRTGFTCSLILGVFFAIILVMSSPYISTFFEMPELVGVLKIIALIFIVDSFVVVSQALLQRKLKLKLYALSDVISYAIGYGLVGVTLAYFGLGVWALVYAHLGRAIIQAIILSYFEYHSIIPYWNQKAFKELFYFGSGFTIGKVANYFALQGDSLIIGKLLGASALGFYSRAYQLMVAPVNLVGNALDSSLFPAMSSIQNDSKKLKHAFLRCSELVALVALPISAIIIINAPEIVLVLLGDIWIEVIFPLQILGAGMIFRMSYKISDSVARALGAVYRRAWRQIVYAIAIFFGAYVGSFWGINGVAFGVTVAILINFLLMTHLSLKQLEIKWSLFLKKHLKPILFSIIFLALPTGIIILLRVYIENIILREILFVCSVSIIALILYYSFRKWLGIESELNNCINRLKSRSYNL